MSEVYITNGNLRAIIAPFNLKGRSYGKRDFFIDIKDFDISLLQKILSTPELALLEAYKEVLADLEESLAIYEKIIKRDTHKYVYEGIAPAYHISHECERLKSDFVNYEIPKIIEGNFDEITKFRQVFRDNVKTIKDGKADLARLRINIAMGWDINYPSISDVDFKNSDSEIFINDDLSDIEHQISKIMFDADVFRNSDPEISHTIDKLGYGTHKRKESSDPDHPLYRWHNYKTELKHLIQTYFRVKLNPNLKFEGRILEELGFRPCSFCSGRK
jgi:hypothetical protein